MFYIVGTPIGNLDDLSVRQAKTIANADIILTEDTRRTGILIAHIEKTFAFTKNTSQRLISYYKDREFDKLPVVLEYIRSQPELQVVLVSDSGMPLISDPGQLLVSHLVKQHIPFTVVPGPTALTTALVASGYRSHFFHFLGFFPKKNNELKKLISSAQIISKTQKDIVFIAYESPNRLHETLSVLNDVVPETDICICRELTKKFEEISRGKAADLMKREYKGEIVLVFQLQ